MRHLVNAYEVWEVRCNLQCDPYLSALSVRYFNNPLPLPLPKGQGPSVSIFLGPTVLTSVQYDTQQPNFT